MASPLADAPSETAPGRRPGPETVALLDASCIPAFLSDPADGADGIVFANAAFLALTGYAHDEVIGRDVQFLQGSKEARAAWAGLRDAAAGVVKTELLCLRRDGSSFWGEISAAPVETGPGRASLRLWQIVDVTRRRDAEGALALSEQREALGLLTNSVAHEFNNFLQILIGYIDGLKRRLGDRPEPFVQRAVTRATEASERAAILTRQLLAYSRRIAPDVRPVDLDAAVATIAEAIRPTLPKGITLAVTTTPGLPPALCNPTQVALALRHIVANSCEAMLGRGGRVEIATFAIAPGDRTLQRPGDGAVGIAITDAGDGMSPEMMARALAPFATSREAGRGTGLAIVHGLMKRQNGTISLDSRPGGGTTVRLVFPVA